jgi:SAM-dependent methyltransferase
LVGPTGRVVGIDANPAILTVARERAKTNGLANVEFVEAPIERIPGNERFDAVVGRYVLLWVADPVAVLRALAGRLRPGGIVAFHEADLRVGMDSIPPSPLLDRCKGWLRALRERVEHQFGIGSTIYGSVLDAGLPGPHLRMETPLGGGPGFPGYDVFAEIVRSMLPQLVAFGIATEEEVEIETFAARLRAEVGERGIFLSYPSILAWTRIAA